MFAVLFNAAVAFLKIQPSEGFYTFSYTDASTSVTFTSIPTKGSEIGHALPLGRVKCLARFSAECSSLRVKGYTSRVIILYPVTSRDSSTVYNTGKTVDVTDNSEVIHLLRYSTIGSFARVVGTSARILGRGFSVSCIVFLVILYDIFDSSTIKTSSLVTGRSPTLCDPRDFFEGQYAPSVPLISRNFSYSDNPEGVSCEQEISTPWHSAVSSKFAALGVSFSVFSATRPRICLPLLEVGSTSLCSNVRTQGQSESEVSLSAVFASAYVS